MSLLERLQADRAAHVGRRTTTLVCRDRMRDAYDHFSAVASAAPKGSAERIEAENLARCARDGVGMAGSVSLVPDALAAYLADAGGTYVWSVVDYDRLVFAEDAQIAELDRAIAAQA